MYINDVDIKNIQKALGKHVLEILNKLPTVAKKWKQSPKIIILHNIAKSL